MSWYETNIFGAPLEVLHKKCGSGSQLHFFSGAGVGGVDGNFVELVEWSIFLWSGVLPNMP
jgi:hypothetical protein